MGQLGQWSHAEGLMIKQKSYHFVDTNGYEKLLFALDYNIQQMKTSFIIFLQSFIVSKKMRDIFYAQHIVIP